MKGPPIANIISSFLFPCEDLHEDAPPKDWPLASAVLYALLDPARDGSHPQSLARSNGTPTHRLAAPGSLSPPDCWVGRGGIWIGVDRLVCLSCTVRIVSPPNVQVFPYVPSRGTMAQGDRHHSYVCPEPRLCPVVIPFTSLGLCPRILETGVTVLHVHLAYYYFVVNYGNPLAFLRGVWSLDVFPVIATCIMINCQSFYTVRILLVGPSKYRLWLVIAIIMLMGGALGVSVASTIVGFRGITLGNFENLLWLVLAYNAVASAGDVILTATLIYILHHSRTGFKSTDSMINRLILYTISTGLLTTIFNIISFILVHVYGVQNWVWLGTMMISERLYSNSLMAALNSRKITNKKRGDDSGPRPAEPYGTAVRASTLRFNHSSAMNEGVELPQVDSSIIEVTRSASGDVKAHPFGDIATPARLE
ncbi:hypothetical protein LXA43DRAFT_364423 [Ganoderma leucocontextum]|nr:hypothetical protein LXA43DRAFT_364423 [Ganoderma leucocontextum]